MIRSEEPTDRDRIDAIDRVKACAILAVIITHSGPSIWSPRITPTDEWLRFSWTAFQVPAFLVMSGALHRTTRPISWPTVAGRLRRLYVPYLVVLTVLYAAGTAPLPPLDELPFALLTGESYGIYYFIPVLSCCVIFGWMLSRCTTRVIVGITAALAALAIAAPSFPTWGPQSPLGQLRDPIRNFWLGYFALGWLAVPRYLASRLPTPLLVLATLAFVPFWTLTASVPVRAVYSLAFVSMLWAIPVRFSGMRFLSEATLGLYLIHKPVQNLMAPHLASWEPIVRIAVAASGSLAVASLLLLTARRILGRGRARAWLGA